MNNCTFFGMRPGKEQRDLCWGDLQLKTDSEGNCFIEFNIERQTKTRTGENPRNIREKKPKMYEDKSNADRCPVNTYLAYKEHRPTSMMTDESPFYLAVNNENPKPGQMWLKCSPLGVNSLRSMLKNMIRDSGLETDKKLVNHSTRKHLVQKLVDNDIPPNEIIQITGHKKLLIKQLLIFIRQETAADFRALCCLMLPVPAKACQPYLLKRILKRKAFYRVQLREVYFKIAKSQR